MSAMASTFTRIEDDAQTGRLAAEPFRARRKSVGLTQAQLAKAADCSPASIANIEAGYVPRASRVVPRVLAALDLLEDRK